MAAAWTLSNAISSLRRRLSDGPSDKYIHQAPVDPDPDGVHEVFGVPDSRLVPDTLLVYLDGEPLEPDAVDLTAGTFTLAPPDTGQKLRASYYFQWFTDTELEEFLTQATGLLGFDGVTDSAMSFAVRTPVLSFAAHYAYLKKAAEAAAAIVASSSGFTSDNSEEHPNWMNLARLAWETAKEELEQVNAPIGAAKPAMKFVTFRLQRYVPRS